MIIARITMGLGNQMFQYAAALALSLEKSSTLKVDISSYSGYHLRRYELDTFFEIDTPKACADEVVRYRYDHPVKKVWNKLIPGKRLRFLGLPYEESVLPKTLLGLFDNIIPAHTRRTYMEPHYHFDKNFFNAAGNTYLHGYWMSWKYFKKHETAIRKAFTVRRSLVQHLDPTASAMQQQNSVSIHIRRTDTLLPEVLKLKGIIPIQFYLNAIKYIQDRTGPVHVYCFSDDIDWVKENLTLKDTHIEYIDKTIANLAIEDFYLMTQCRHNIIANSTFSWWAAYLNDQNNKIVVAPRKWYNITKYNAKDVYPPSWTLLDW